MFRRRPGDPDRMPDSIAAPRAAPNPEVPKRYSSVTAGAERSPPSCAHRRTYPRRISETRCCGHCSDSSTSSPTTGCTCPRRQRYEDREARLDAGLEFRGSSSPPQRRTTPRSPNSDTTRSRPCPQRCARQIASAPGRSARPGPTTAPPEQVREPRTTLRRRARSVSPPEPWHADVLGDFRGPSQRLVPARTEQVSLVRSDDHTIGNSSNGSAVDVADRVDHHVDNATTTQIGVRRSRDIECPRLGHHNRCADNSAREPVVAPQDPRQRRPPHPGSPGDHQFRAALSAIRAPSEPPRRLPNRSMSADMPERATDRSAPRRRRRSILRATFVTNYCMQILCSSPPHVPIVSVRFCQVLGKDGR